MNTRLGKTGCMDAAEKILTSNYPIKRIGVVVVVVYVFPTNLQHL